ncbi:putative terminase, large subunit [Pseudomonas phage PPpW-3]|uniref:Terminase, large subunit n=1 Tax=Pseudomonas phage PPpW-3 TaxID=1279082 RepID=V5YTA4_9CAUD|nr:terminase large subunit [Pseudomonas phage PPpW-3]BAO20602.1 putative terminase, large subunit [Pseudomonas phage PPpW-3]
MSSAQFTNWEAVASAAARAARNLVPPPDMLLSTWGEKNVRIPVGNAKPGPIRFDNAPYQRGMVDVVKEPGIRLVDYMTGAQLGKTTVQQIITGYFIHHEPRSQIFAQPSQGDMQTFLETKLTPMLEANPAIASKMAKQRGREGVNNSRIKSYIGGWLMMAWAGSTKTARGRSAPVVQADEVDGMPPTAEGDFVELLSQRAATFGDQRLVTRSSTPTVKGASRIETGYMEGDQRRYYVPCPHCEHPQYLKWTSVSWHGRQSTGIEDAEEDKGREHDPDSVRYYCEACGAGWDDGERIAAIRNAERLGHGWKASRPFKGHASFHAPEMLSTFRRLRDIVQSYLDKLAVDDVQSFVNVSLAETYEEKGEKADPTGLRARAEEYRAEVPAGGMYLTAGIDQQMDRLEVEVVAWGIGEESWSIAYYVLWGSPEQGDVWEDLDDLLASTYQHESGAVMPIMAAVLDTGGSNGMTQAAYDYAKGRTGRRLFAGKGISGWGRPIVEKPQRKQSGKNARKVDLFLVGVDEAKLIVMRRLAATVAAKEPGGPGYCHTPADRDEDWYKQLTAEKLVTRYLKGQPVREWHKPDRARNEGLDCRVYAYAALKIMNPSFKRLAERLGVPAPASRKKPAPVGTAAERLRDALLAARAAAKADNDNQAPTANPQEDTTPPAKQTKPNIKRSKAAAGRRKGWVNNF